MALVLVTPPAQEPVSLAEAKAHLRVDTADDDALIQALIVAAREHVEHITRRALITQSWDLILDAFPAGEIVMPRPPLQSVTSITYRLQDGTAVTLDPANYVVDAKSEPGRVVLVPGKSWPSEELYPASSVVIRYTAGYGDPGAVPVAIKQAILLLVGHWYENREAAAVGHTVIQLPMTVDALLWPYRVWWF
jgi:uncharacterized phiE125 gp8 family phage protein